MTDCFEGVLAGRDVGEDLDEHAVGRDCRSTGHLEKVVGVLTLPVGLGAIVLVDGGVRVDHDKSGREVQGEIHGCRSGYLGTKR